MDIDLPNSDVLCRSSLSKFILLAGAFDVNQPCLSVFSVAFFFHILNCAELVISLAQSCHISNKGSWS